MIFSGKRPIATFVCSLVLVINFVCLLQLFSGNKDPNSTKKNYLHPQVTAHFIRFKPNEWNKRICMRVEVYGCLLNPDISPEDIPAPTKPPHVTEVTESPSLETTLVAAQAGKSEYSWGAYLGIVFGILLILGIVIAVICWKRKAKRKRVRLAEQASLLGLRSAENGDYKVIEKAADELNGDSIDENQV